MIVVRYKPAPSDDTVDLQPVPPTGASKYLKTEVITILETLLNTADHVPDPGAWVGIHIEG